MSSPSIFITEGLVALHQWAAVGLSTQSHLRPVHFADLITFLFPAPLHSPALVTGAGVIVHSVSLATITPAPDVTRRPMMG